MANEYGVTPDGFKRKRLPEIKASLEARIAAALGVPITTRPDSVFQQLIGPFAADYADVWEGLEATYYAMYPHTAEGVNLSNALAFGGVQKVSAEKTMLTATCFGSNNTPIPMLSRIKSTVDEKAVFLLPNSGGQISTSAANYVDIAVVTVEEGATYSLTIDGQNYNYEAPGGATATSILVGIAALLGALPATVTVSNSRLIIELTDQRTSSSFSVSTKLQFMKVGSPLVFECENYGPIDPVIGTVTQIMTQTAGWESVSNKVAAIVGREDETDIEVRQRYGRSVYTKGSALIEAMQARIYEEVEGVTAAVVFENDTDAEDADGRPPHSVEAVVQGGDSAAIAQKIWQTKPPGIPTFGAVAVTVTDSQGVDRLIKFNRPTSKKVWIKVVITRNLEEQFPGDTPQQVQQIMLEEGNKQRVGQDVILQKFLGPIYRQTLGIGGLAITAAVSEAQPAPGDYTANNIAIGARELAEFVLARIEVTVA